MDIKNIRLLYHPYYVLSLTILILNDHFFKYAYPSYLTGKLSDFTGLFIFIVFIQSFFEINKKNFFFISSLTAITFLILKTFSFGDFNDYLPVITKDISDLIALLVILPTYFYVFHYYYNDLFQFKKFKHLILGVSILAILATSPPPRALFHGSNNGYSELPIFIENPEFQIVLSEILIFKHSIYANLEILNKTNGWVKIKAKDISVQFKDSLYQLDNIYFDDKSNEELTISANEEIDFTLRIKNLEIFLDHTYNYSEKYSFELIFNTIETSTKFYKFEPIPLITK
jgi:hypothetical protein